MFLSKQTVVSYFFFNVLKMIGLMVRFSTFSGGAISLSLPIDNRCSSCETVFDGWMRLSMPVW